MLIGSDEQNYKAVEAAIGRKVDVIRAYRWKGANHSSLLDLAKAGYIVWASYKYRLPDGTVIQASTIPAQGGKPGAIDADQDVFDGVMCSCPRNSKGPHRKGYEHEEDAKTAAQAGNPTQLNAAIDYSIGRNRAKTVAAGVQDFVCWTGYDLLNREPLYRAAGQAADVIMLDPYELAATGPWTSLVASYGQDLNYLRKVYGKPVCFGECNAPNTAGPGMQAGYMNQTRHDLEAQYPEVDGICLWQGGNLSETPAELALMKNGFFAAGTLNTVTVPGSAIAGIKTAQGSYDAARADYQAKLTAYDAALQAMQSADTTMEVSASNFAKAADALEAASKAVTG